MAILARLGRSWGELTPQGGWLPISRHVLGRFSDPSWAPKRTQDGAQDETLRPQDDPRGRQDGTQDDQNRSENRLQKRSRLRTVLRPSWGDLGPILAPSWGHFWWFCIGFCTISWKSTFSKKSRFKTRLGSILGRFGWPKGSSWEALGGQVGGKEVSRSGLGRS